MLSAEELQSLVGTPETAAALLEIKAALPKPKCAPRKRFSTEQAARAAAVRSGRLVEPCHFCNGWHLA